MTPKRKYDATVARVAGNLLSGNSEHWQRPDRRDQIVRQAVATARAIIAEIERTEIDAAD